MPSSKPYISVIIPAYNRASYIEAAINSTLKQKGKWNFEIIVVDDGSTDNTEELLKQFGKKISYYKIPHSGLPAVARNFGISKAKGDIIAFQDSDDLWPEDKFIKQVPEFDDQNIVMVYGQAQSMDAHGKLTRKNVVEPTKLKNGEKFELLIKENVISTLTTMVRKDMLENLGGFNENPELRAIEDYELWLRVSATFPGTIKSLKDTLAYYRLHDQNISSATSLIAIERLLTVYNKLWNFGLPNDKNYQDLEKQIEIMEENWSRQQNINGRTPAISVVMGIYKDTKFVKKAVNSILNQTFRDFEFIIVDDGSQDGSFEAVSSFKDPRIRIVRQTNHGLVSVLNKGVRLARAKLIARQDADDISLPQRFEKELALIDKDEKLGVVGTFFSYVDEKTLKPTGVIIAGPTKSIDLARNLYFNNPIGHGTALIRKQAIDDAGGYSDKYGPNEDYYLWHKIVTAGWQIGIVPDVFYLYRLSSQSISRTKEELQHKLFAKLNSDIWQGPIYNKSFWRIIADNWYYRKLDSPYHGVICAEYKSHQVKLSFEFLIHGKLLAGYNSFIGTLILYPKGAFKLWKTVLWAPIKYLREFR